MPVFEADRPEITTRYESLKRAGSPRIVGIGIGSENPFCQVVRKVCGENNIVIENEIRNGTWTQYSEKDAKTTGSEGTYMVDLKGDDGSYRFLRYHVGTDGIVEIDAQPGSKRPPFFARDSFGIDAKVTLEPDPVLNFIQIIPVIPAA